MYQSIPNRGFLSKFFNKHIDPMSPDYIYTEMRYIPGRWVTIKHIPVKQEDNENDWKFEVVDAGNGVKKLAVF